VCPRFRPELRGPSYRLTNVDWPSSIARLRFLSLSHRVSTPRSSSKSHEWQPGNSSPVSPQGVTAAVPCLSGQISRLGGDSRILVQD
jgi:hypothetical protein